MWGKQLDCGAGLAAPKPLLITLLTIFEMYMDNGNDQWFRTFMVMIQLSMYTGMYTLRLLVFFTFLCNTCMFLFLKLDIYENVINMINVVCNMLIIYVIYDHVHYYVTKRCKLIS